MNVRPRVLGIVLVLAPLACMKPNPLLDELADEGETAGDDDVDDDGAAPLDIPGGANSCAPPEAFSPECGVCLAESCCELAFACSEVEDCTCLANCMLDGGNAGSCRIQCGGAKAADVDELEPLLACADGQCGGSC